MSKTVILMRHGQYVDAKHARAFRWGATEMLTPRGCEDVDDVAQQMAESDCIPDVIVYSPAPRTTETALRMRDVFKRVSGRDVPVVLDANLGDGYGADDAMKVFSNPACAGAKTILTVSHEPNIAVFSGRLGEMIFADKGQAIVFSPGIDEWTDIPKSKPVKILSPRRP